MKLVLKYHLICWGCQKRIWFRWNMVYDDDLLIYHKRCLKETKQEG